MKNRPQILTQAAAFVFILASLFYLRMIPAIGDNVEFSYDRAFNYRITSTTLREGRVPVVDRLSTYPGGKNIRAFLPIGMYYACALFHKLINYLSTVSLNRSILFFCSLAGSLICIPLYFLSYEIYRSRAIAFLSAFIGGIIPAYLHRSLCYWYRYEMLATPILFMSLLFFIRAFRFSSRGRVFLNSFISALFLILALYIWRLSILFLAAYIAAFLYIWLNSHDFPKQKWAIPLIVVTPILLVLLLTSGFGTQSFAANYMSFPRAVFEIITYKAGLREGLSEFARLIYYNRELHGVDLPAMFGNSLLSLSGILALFYIFLYFKNKESAYQKQILLAFLVFFLIFTSIFLRNKILLGPVVALTLGEAAVFALRKKGLILRNIFLAVIAIILVNTGYDSWRLVTTRADSIKIRPYLKEAIDSINKLTPEDSVLLCHWPDGYPIQTYCSRPTVTDGLFESPEIVERIIGLSKIYYLGNEERLQAFCRKYGVSHLLVPVNKKMVYAGYAGIDYKKYFIGGNPTAKGRLTLLYRLISKAGLRDFKLLYSNDEFRLYSVNGL